MKQQGLEAKRMNKLKPYEFWFVTGSQHLYGPETLMQAEEHARIIVRGLGDDGGIPFEVVMKPIVTTPGMIREVMVDANTNENCAGVITWMHTFSPAKMWIAGLTVLRKPLLHLHTQFNRDIPWDSIDMDFMNLNQSAHGDREYGFIGARMGIPRKVVVGHWQSNEVKARIGNWMRVAVTVLESRNLKVARFGDNMRQVAVTEGDKVEAEIKFGWSVDGYGVGDLARQIQNISHKQVSELLDEYNARYEISDEIKKSGTRMESIREQARIELGIRSFLEEGDYQAFTTTFEDLHGLKQLPGLAAQHLMADGYGFGGEGDWKTAALVRLVKVMAGFEGTSFMEDYTYHLEAGNELVLGAHMLEVCPTIAATCPGIEVHPLSIGGKEDPARLIFDGRSGSAVCASLIDLGNRFRLVVNEVDAVQPDKDMPNLPVARVLWQPQPSLQGAAEAWIYAGGAHHTAFSYNVSAEQLYDLAEILGIEYVLINRDTKVMNLRNELRWNDLAYRLG
jgi:L-arabinose isomerase